MLLGHINNGWSGVEIMHEAWEWNDENLSWILVSGNWLGLYSIETIEKIINLIKMPAKEDLGISVEFHKPWQ